MYPVPPPAIFFDFDGVILESADIKTNAFAAMFKNLPEADAIIDYHINNMGVSRYKKFEWIYKNILGKEIDQTELDRLGNQFSEIVFKQIVAAPLVAGAKRLLEKTQGVCHAFIASGTPQDELEQIVAVRNLSNFFSEVCGTPRTKTEIVKSLSAKYSLDATRCWFIGDANTDYEAAMENKMKFIARITPEMSNYWKGRDGFWKVHDLEEVADNWI